jgi:hypothetical protein
VYIPIVRNRIKSPQVIERLVYYYVNFKNLIKTEVVKCISLQEHSDSDVHFVLDQHT